MIDYNNKLTARGALALVRTGGVPSRCLVLVALLALAAVVGLAVPVRSNAAFTRAPAGRIVETPAGPLGEPLALAVDGAGNLWTSEHLFAPFTLNEFTAPGPAGNEYIKSLSVEGLTPPPELGETRPDSMAIDDTTGTFYLAGSLEVSPNAESNVEVFDSAGNYLRRWQVERAAHVAVDNSAGASSGDVYVVSGNVQIRLQRFNSMGEAVPFTATGPCIKGNEVVGIPREGGASCETFEGFVPLHGVAVDGEGNVYVAFNVEGTRSVLEYRASGSLVRAFGGTETPGIGESRAGNGFGGDLEGVAIDRASGHLLVAVTKHEAVQGKEIPIESAVDEFDLASGRYLSQISTSASKGGQAVAFKNAVELATDPSGVLYVADPTSRAVDVFQPGHFLPTARTLAPTQRTQTTAVLVGSVNVEAGLNPEKAGLSSCTFEYVTQAAFESAGFAGATQAQCQPAAGSLPVDSLTHEVHAAVAGLLSGTTYRYRLTATTEGALGGTSIGAAIPFTAPAMPRIDSSTASSVSSAFAELSATIDPLGASTSYHFEYDTRPYSGSETHGLRAPASDVGIGAGGPTGNSVESVAQALGGLDAGVTYHFRVVAQNEVGTTYGPDMTFATQPASTTGLPEARKYELVTPARKLGGSDMFGLPMLNNEYTSTDVGTPDVAGDGLIFWTHAAFGAFPGNEGSAYVFKRSARGWETTSLASPALGVQNLTDDFVFDPLDLSRVGVNDEVGSIASEGGASRSAMVGAPGGPYSSIATGPASHETGEKRLQIEGASHDVDRVVVESPSHTLCPGAEGVKHGETLCEWDGSGFKLVNANDEDELLGTCGAVLGAGSANGPGSGGLSHDAVSPDGSKVLFTSPEPVLKGAGPGCWSSKEGSADLNAPQLYLRSAGTTLEISAPQPGVIDPTGVHFAIYVGASEDDSRIFFLSEGWLTADHPIGHDLELYECELVAGESGQPACELRRVSAGETGFSGRSEGAHIYTVPVVSAQGRAVYFTAAGELASGAVAQRSNPERASPVNLYRYDTASGTTTYVATVSEADAPVATVECETRGRFARPVGQCSAANWYTTPDGRYLVFSSWHELTGNDTSGPCRLPSSTVAPLGHCDEVYRYDAVSKSLTCVSCSPSGAPLTSNAEFARSAPGEPGSGAVAAITDNGADVFFDTADPLVPADSNGTLDVYEWHDGRISLLSSGKDSGPSFFLGMSSVQTPSGPIEAANVFIGTHSQLLAEDSDSSGDIYDARICTTELPCIEPAAGGTAQCEGDACQTPPASPLDATPTSATFSGAGNLAGQASAPVKVAPKKKLTNAQRLAAALKQCRKKRGGKARRACEAQARKRFAKKRVKGAKKRANNQGRRKGR